jgi:hypothetical protein
MDALDDHVALIRYFPQAAEHVPLHVILCGYIKPDFFLKAAAADYRTVESVEVIRRSDKDDVL